MGEAMPRPLRHLHVVKDPQRLSPEAEARLCEQGFCMREPGHDGPHLIDAFAVYLAYRSLRPKRAPVADVIPFSSRPPTAEETTDEP